MANPKIQPTLSNFWYILLVPGYITLGGLVSTVAAIGYDFSAALGIIYCLLTVILLSGLREAKPTTLKLAWYLHIATLLVFVLTNNALLGALSTLLVAVGSITVIIALLRNTPHIIALSRSHYIFLAAALLPFLAVFIGSVINPTGWATHVYTLPVLALLILATSFMPFLNPFTIACLVLIVILAIVFIGFARKKTPRSGSKLFAIIVLILSAAYSFFIGSVVATASEDEFAG